MASVVDFTACWGGDSPKFGRGLVLSRFDPDLALLGSGDVAIAMIRKDCPTNKY